MASAETQTCELDSPLHPVIVNMKQKPSEDQIDSTKNQDDDFDEFKRASIIDDLDQLEEP
jgi:hypothetical protein